MFKASLLRAISASLLLATFALAGEEPTLDARLEQLAETLESARVQAHVPGMSIAIVKDDEIVWARGFGLADVDGERAADESTIYAVGSTTKAFTATLVGMLVDEDTVGWDDPVAEHLSYFDLQVRSDDEGAECTLRDLLSHRHGFVRMPVLYGGSDVTREELLRTAAGAEPLDDFRQGFHYCNVAYLAAGEAAGVAAGSTWDELMAERLFEPLGMEASSVSLPATRKDARLALGYKWDEATELLEHEKMFDLEVIAPAGAVNSNVLDMAQWLRLQLSRGTLDGTRLISAEQLLETWEPQIEIAGGVSYGLGWMLREHDGRQVVEHGGNINGFSAQVGMMPEENLGFVLLMNLDVAPLQQTALELVFDGLLDAWPDAVAEGVVATSTDVDFEDYTGIYIANFLSFDDAELEILESGDKLGIIIPGQPSSDLELPDEGGKWVSTRSADVAVSFQHDEGGAVVGLTIHTSGFSFEVPRKGVVLEPEAPAEGLEKFTGAFIRAQGGKRVELSVEKGRLSMLDRGKQLVFNTPDDDGHASLRARADYGATFKIDAEGNVESFVFHGQSGDKLFRRATDAVELPSLGEVLALRKTDARIAAVKKAGGTRRSGEVWVAQAGVRGSVTIHSQGDDRFANHMDFGKFGRIESVARGREAWTYSSMGGFDALTGDQLAQALLEHPAAVAGDWNDYFDGVEVIRNDTLHERAVHVVRLRKGDLPSRTYAIDAESGDVLQVKQIVIEGPVRIPVTVSYSDFEEFDGIRQAMCIEIENPAAGRMVLTFDERESGLELGDEVFTLEDPDA